MKYKGIKSLLCGLFSLMISSNALHATELLGAGATFPYPFYSKIFDEYHKKTGVKVNYQSIGSGGGQRQIQNRTVDFGASDEFLNDEKISKMPGKILHLPTCLGSVAIAYNIPGNPVLNLSGDIIANIFMGKITKWNDPAIKALNPKVKLPEVQITVIRRSDGSGTTAVFSDYLSKVSLDWKNKVGSGNSLNWLVGLGGKGNEGVSGLIKQVPGAIGYIETTYALQNKFPIAAVQNKAGVFVKPTVQSVSAAAMTKLPDDTRVSVTDTSVKTGYPISGFTWILFYQDQSYNGRTKEQALELVKLLSWVITDGQKFAEPLDYAKLPVEAQKKAKLILASLTFNGQVISK